MDNCKDILIASLTSLNIEFSEIQIELLLKFLALIEKWNKTYNLTAIRDKSEMARLHIVDSLAILPFLHGQRYLDVGTGAGLPGIPLAIFKPQQTFVLLDSNAKKTRFIQQVILELNLKNIEIQTQRVENYYPPLLFNQILTRAFADTEMMLKLTAHLLADQGEWLAMKSQPSAEELHSSFAFIKKIDLDIPQLNAHRCLLKIKPINRDYLPIIRSETHS